MHNIILAIHIILAILLIVVVLMQRSEGGGLGMGSSSGGNAKAATRGGLEAIGKFTWVLAAGFVITSLTLTVMAARSTGSSTVLDVINSLPSTQEAPVETPGQSLPLLPSGETSSRSTSE